MIDAIGLFNANGGQTDSLTNTGTTDVPMADMFISVDPRACVFEVGSPAFQHGSVRMNAHMSDRFIESSSTGYVATSTLTAVCLWPQACRSPCLPSCFLATPSFRAIASSFARVHGAHLQLPEPSTAERMENCVLRGALDMRIGIHADRCAVVCVGMCVSAGKRIFIVSPHVHTRTDATIRVSILNAAASSINTVPNCPAPNFALSVYVR